MDTKQLREMIEEAVAAFLDEFNYADRIAAMRQQRPSSGGEDQIQIGQLIGALDNMRKSGKKTLSMAELQGALKSATAVATPMGKGSMKDLAGVTAAAAQQATPTRGQPLVKPPASLYAREGRVRMSEAQLKEMVNRVVAQKIHEQFGMGNPIMAKREIIALMDQTSRSFEQEIIKTFKLQNPDLLAPELQRSYLEIVEGMKAKLVQAAMEAVQQLIKFPKTDEGNGGMK